MSKTGGEKETPNEAYSTENLIEDESEVDETFTVIPINQRRLNGDNYSRENFIHIKMDRLENGQFQNESSETNGDVSKIVLTNVKIDNHQNTLSGISMENIKGSTEETSLEERRDELNTRNHSSYEEYPSNQTLTDIDSLPIHFVADTNKRKKHHNLQKTVKIPNKVYTCQYPKRICEKETCHAENCDIDSTKQNIHQHLNRYNNSHVQIYQTRHSKRPWYFPFTTKKKKYKLKNLSTRSRPYSTSDSGETVPQLYKAKMIADLSSIPRMFKFRAVRGNSRPLFTIPPQKEIPLIPSDKKHIHVNEEGQQCDDGKYNINGYRCMKCNSLKTHKCISKQLFPGKTDGQMGAKERFYDRSNVRACLNLDGMEYISTNEPPQRIDVYCFDHLNTSYFRTTDQPPPLLTDEAIQRTEDIATRFWAEIFGFCHLFISFLTAFILQLYKFFLFSFIRPLLSGLVQLTSDYLLKPLLTIFYNGFFQPVMVFAFNLATSLRDVCQPLARGLGFFLSEIAVLLRAIRVAEWNRTVKKPPLKDSYC